jgi:fatty-acyl-CoA synthase
MGVIAALRQASDLPAKLGSVGRQPSTSIWPCCAAKGRPVAVGEVGEMATRGDNVMIGYYNEPEQTAAFFKHGGGWGLERRRGHGGRRWLAHAGGPRQGHADLRRRERLSQGDRGRHCMAWSRWPSVAVFGTPDDKFGEVPAAYMQLKPGASLSEAEVLARCEAQLARLKRPRLVKFVEGFPKTAIGKIQKNVLKEPFWQGRKKI